MKPREEKGKGAEGRSAAAKTSRQKAQVKSTEERNEKSTVRAREKQPTVRRPKSEEEIWAATKAAAKGKYLSIKAWRRVRSNLTNKTGWTAQRYDAWMAKQVQAGKLQVAKSNPAVGTEDRREEAIEVQNPWGEKQTMLAIQSVRKWVEKRVSGDTITAPMVMQMEKNLTREHDTTHRIAVAILTVAAEKGLQVEDRRTGVGRQKRNWLQETKAWATAQKIRIAGTTQAMREANQRVKQHPKAKEAVCMEEGSGWEGATKGLRQAFDRVITSDKVRQTIKGKDKADPDFLEDITKYKGDERGWVSRKATKARVRQGELQALWISAPCTEETTAQGFNKGKKWGKGHYSGKKRSKVAQKVLDTLVEGAWQATQEIKGLQMCMENPWTTALTKETSITTKWGKGIKVGGCAYGAPTKKPYRLWMTPATAHEFMKVRIEPHDARSECSICRGKPNARHTRAAITEKGSKRKRTDTTEANGDASRNRVPWKLAKQVGQCMMAAYRKTSRG